MIDYHVHSNYSDGRFIHEMLYAAEELGLAGIGFADHCNVSNRESMHRYREDHGFALDITYERRRSAIRRQREKYDVDAFDAVEMDYKPEDEPEIREFLAEAGFRYAIGSVHELYGENIHMDYFADCSADEQAEAVQDYFDAVVSLVESGLFDILGHPDLVERNTALRGLATECQYRAVASALEDSPTIPELNAGRIDGDFGTFHPSPSFRDILAEYDVPIVLGSDAHGPGVLRDRVPQLREQRSDLELELSSGPIL